MSGHRLTISGEGPTGTGYDVELDGQKIRCTQVSLDMGVKDVNKATITIYLSQLAVSADAQVDLGLVEPKPTREEAA